MYLSKLVLDWRSRQVQAELANRYELHRTLASAFASADYTADRLLYRVEMSRQEPPLTILLQSATSPNWAALEQKRYLLRPAETRPYNPQVQAGERFAFRLLANPTRRLRSQKEDVPGKRVPLYGFDDQQGWIERKAGQHGFQLLAVQVTNLTDEYAYKVIEKERTRLTHHGVRYEGVLQVTDAAHFAQTLAGGIGSAKGFGFGLLSIARV
jgi:CRISPR system Cascade subunit CasE